MGGGASKSAGDATMVPNSGGPAGAEGTLTVPPQAADAPATGGGAAAADTEEDGIYNGFLVQTNIKFDLSVPTNAVEGALLVVNVIVKLIQAFVNRNKFMQAMQTRIIVIEGAVTSLQKRTSALEAALPALQNLVKLLVDFKQFVKYVTRKPESFFDKAINFFRAKSDLENLADYDTLFTRALADLNVPLQADQLCLMEQQRTSLTKLSEDIAKVLAKLDETRVLAISKKCLTHEEALAFWMECLPDRFLVPVRDFVPILLVWFQTCRGMRVTQRAVQNIVASINLGEVNEGGGGAVAGDAEPLEEAPDEFIDAREANLLFASLPDGYATMPFEEVVKVVSAHVKEKRETDLKNLKAAREQAARKLMNTTEELSRAERELKDSLGSLFHVRFVCEAYSIVHGRFERRDDVNCAYVVENGAVHVMGKDLVSEREANWVGKLYDDLSFEIGVPDDYAAVNATSVGSPVTGRGEFRGNLLIAHCVLHTGLQVFYFRLPTLVRWDGYWELPNGQRGDMFLYLGEDTANGMVDAISDDDAGVAIWRGTMDKKDFVVTKKYLNQHFVHYTGAVKQKPDGLRHVKGDWSIPGDWSGTFELWEVPPTK